MFASLVVLLAQAPAHAAGSLSLKPSNEIEMGVPLSAAATENLTGTKKTLNLVGYGTRFKRVAFINVKVYVAQWFADSQDHMQSMQLTFLRTVDSAAVMQSFRDGLNANNINTSDSEVAHFLNAVANSGDAVTGTTLTISGYTNANGSEVVAYEDSSGRITSILGKPGFMKKIMSIWLGEPADGGLRALRNELLEIPAVTPAH